MAATGSYALNRNKLSKSYYNQHIRIPGGERTSHSRPSLAQKEHAGRSTRASACTKPSNAYPLCISAASAYQVDQRATSESMFWRYLHCVHPRCDFWRYVDRCFCGLSSVCASLSVIPASAIREGQSQARDIRGCAGFGMGG